MESIASTRSDVMTSGQLTGVVNDLLQACDPILQKHGIYDRDGAMMQMMVLSFAVGSIIGTGCDADHRERAVLAAIANMRKGISLSAATGWLATMLGSCGTVH